MKVKTKIIASLKIWIVIYPALTMVLYLFNEPLSSIPVYLRTLLMTIILVPLVVFLGVPFVDSIIRILSHKKQKTEI